MRSLIAGGRGQIGQDRRPVPNNPFYASASALDAPHRRLVQAIRMLLSGRQRRPGHQDRSVAAGSAQDLQPRRQPCLADSVRHDQGRQATQVSGRPERRFRPALVPGVGPLPERWRHIRMRRRDDDVDGGQGASQDPPG